jgi:hypothetical protein
MATEDPKIVRIVNKAKKGDDKAFKTLLKMVEPDLKKIASHFFILGGDREDVMQELRLGVYKAVNSYDCTKDTTFKNFCVNLVCKRHLATAISSAKRMKNSVLNDSLSLDSPIILGCFYESRYGADYPASHYSMSGLSKFLWNLFKQYDNINILLTRNDETYDPNGRMQDLKEAIEIDNDIKETLTINSVKFMEFSVDNNAANRIFNYIKNNL